MEALSLLASNFMLCLCEKEFSNAEPIQSVSVTPS